MADLNQLTAQVELIVTSLSNERGFTDARLHKANILDRLESIEKDLKLIKEKLAIPEEE